MMKFLVLLLVICSIGFGQAPAGKGKTKLPRPEILRLMDGSTLAQELDSFIEEESQANNRRPLLRVSFINRALVSLAYEWETMGAYPSSGKTHHVFDLSTKREVILWEEIKPSERRSFERFLKDKIQPLMNKHRKEYPAKDWEIVFQGDDQADPRSIERRLLIAGLTRFKTFYIAKGSIHFLIESYWDFPHVIQALDFTCDIPIQFSELNPFLKKSSLLRL